MRDARNPSLAQKQNYRKQLREMWTYQETGKYSQVQCLCNSGWHRWQPGSQDSLLFKEKRLRCLTTNTAQDFKKIFLQFLVYVQPEQL